MSELQVNARARASVHDGGRGATAVRLAMRSGMAEIVALLRESGADLCIGMEDVVEDEGGGSGLGRRAVHDLCAAPGPLSAWGQSLMLSCLRELLWLDQNAVTASRVKAAAEGVKKGNDECIMWAEQLTMEDV